MVLCKLLEQLVGWVFRRGGALQPLRGRNHPHIAVTGSIGTMHSVGLACLLGLLAWADLARTLCVRYGTPVSYGTCVGLPELVFGKAWLLMQGGCSSRASVRCGSGAGNLHCLAHTATARCTAEHAVPLKHCAGAYMMAAQCAGCHQHAGSA